MKPFFVRVNTAYNTPLYYSLFKDPILPMMRTYRSSVEPKNNNMLVLSTTDNNVNCRRSISPEGQSQLWREHVLQLGTVPRLSPRYFIFDLKLA